MNYYNYFTEIEEHFVRRRGKHLLVSPMDWGLIASWRDAGVPLQVAIRGIDIAMDSFFSKQRANSKVNSLCYCHDSVMAEYADYLEAHLGESPAAEQDRANSDDANGPETGAVIEYIAERIAEIKKLSGKQSGGNASEGIERVLSRLEELHRDIASGAGMDMEALERDLAILDDLLVAELRALISEEKMEEWEKEAKKELKIYKKRLPKETFEKIRGNFLRDKIHRAFHIGELSILRL